MTYLDKIKEISIVDHAERMGYTLVKKGKYYSLKEHDSVMIDIRKNCFWRNSSFSFGFKGGAGSVIDFVMEFEGYQDVKSAMDSLASEYGIERDNYEKVVIPKRERVIPDQKPQKEPGVLELPEQDDNIDAAYKYLLNTRKISKEVIAYFIKKDMLYQDVRKNVVFKTDKFACLRSTGSKKFVRDVKGCDYNRCFFFKGKENVDTMIISESVIDIMSIMSIYAKQGKDIENYAYLALSGTNKLGSVFYNLENESGIRNIIIGCDNDQPGINATEKIINAVQERKLDVSWIVQNAPSGKDWNEYLVSISQRDQEQISSNTRIPDVSLFGKIMQDIYKTAMESEEPVWFLEKERFEDGEFTQEDLDALNKDIETLESQYGIKDIRNIIECVDGDWMKADDAVATFYGDFINVFDKEKEMNKTKQEKVIVSIESTDDYADTSFHKELINSDIQNEDGSYGKLVDAYRIVTIGENNRLIPYDEKVFTSYEDALNYVQQIENVEVISYDDIIHVVAKSIQKESFSLSQEITGVNEAEYKYYSILRPIELGTYPKDGMKSFQNFDEKKYINEIEREAWGVLTYNRLLTESEINEYDLAAVPLKNMNLEQRLHGQQLDQAKNMIESLREVGNVEDEEKGIVNLYYSTNQKNAELILKTGKMKSERFGDINGILLSTEPSALKEGDVIIKLSIPVEKVELNNYDIDNEVATFYLQSDERIFSVNDYNLEIVQSPHREENRTEEVNEKKEVEKGVAREKISLAGATKDEMKEHLISGIQNIMNSDDYKNWLNTGSKLFYNNYSFNNAMLIWMQKESATHVMGYEAWKDFGRAVQKGAKGVKILMPVMAYEKKEGGLYQNIISALNDQLKKDPDLSMATHRLFSSQIEFTMNKANMIGLKIAGKEKHIFENHEQLKKFITKNILGKVPMYFTVGTVFDAKDTYAPEFLWVSRGYTKDELVLDDKGKPIKNKKGEYKIYNTLERQARFNPALDTSIVARDPEKMKELMDVLKTVSEKNGIPVYMKDRNEDDTLRDGAEGYFCRKFDDNHPKGYTVINKELEITEMCSVMFHEMAHSDMHGSLEKIKELSSQIGEEASSSIRELQAESVAYMTASTFGIETSTHSFTYLASYAKGFDVQGLQMSMDAIYTECKKLTREIAEELESRGLNLDLSQKEPEKMISSQEIQKITQEYMGYVCEKEEKLNEIQNEMPSLVIEYKDDENIISILRNQKENVLSQLDDISVIKKETENLENALNRNIQNQCINHMKSAKERIEIKSEEFKNLTDSFIEVRNSRFGTLSEELQKKTMKTLNELSKEFPQLNQLSKMQLHYIATSNYIKKNYKLLLNNNPEAFVNIVMKRAEALPDIASKNGMFVEVNFCEQWTEQSIFEKGTMCHPKMANLIIKNAEQQIQELRKKSEEKGEYFPYTKCDLTIYYGQENGERMAFNTRVDIGDGSQKDLISHLESISVLKRKELVNNFLDSVKERNVNMKILHIEVQKEDIHLDTDEIKENSTASLMKEWKAKIDERKKDPGIQEQINESKGRDIYERI